MAWFGLDSLLLGTDLEAEQQRSDQADAALAELTKKKLEAGKVTPENYAKTMSNIDAGRVDVASSVNAEFLAGLAETPDRIRAGLGAAVGSILGSIPLRLWLIGGIVLFFYLGGGQLLRARLTR